MATWFITIRTYGTWLHGDERGSVDDRQNKHGEPFIPHAMAWEKHERSLLKHAPVTLNDAMRAAVDSAIREVCAYRGWTLHELNVRTNHVHCVVSAEAAAEKVMNDCKAYATRRLRNDGLMSREMEVWAKHGSSPEVVVPEQLVRVCRYVRDQ